MCASSGPVLESRIEKLSVMQIWPIMAIAGTQAVSAGTPGVSVQFVPQQKPATGVFCCTSIPLLSILVRTASQEGHRVRSKAATDEGLCFTLKWPLC